MRELAGWVIVALLCEPLPQADAVCSVATSRIYPTRQACEIRAQGWFRKLSYPGRPDLRGGGCVKWYGEGRPAARLPAVREVEEAGTPR